MCLSGSPSICLARPAGSVPAPADYSLPLLGLRPSCRLLLGLWRPGSAPRLLSTPPLPYAPPPRSRARSGRRRRTWREIGKWFCALPRQLQFLRARDETCRHTDASERRLGPGAAGATRILTPARLPLQARPAGVRARRGPGWGDVSADALVSSGVLAPFLQSANRRWGLPTGMHPARQPCARVPPDAGERATVRGSRDPSPGFPGLLGPGARKRGFPPRDPVPALGEVHHLPPNCRVGKEGWCARCQLEAHNWAGGMSLQVAASGRQKSPRHLSSKSGSNSLESLSCLHSGKHKAPGPSAGCETGDSLSVSWGFGGRFGLVSETLFLSHASFG